MATLVCVHGTFAHRGIVDGKASLGEGGAAPWWVAESGFEADARKLITAESGNLEFKSFVWSALNSEVGRREAGAALLSELRALDQRQEPYCVVGHSHGGSVIASALVQSAVGKQPLSFLRKVVTVGTPFISMRGRSFGKSNFANVFARMSFARRAIYVAALLLLLSLLFMLLGTLFGGALSERALTSLILSSLLLGLPFLIIHFTFKHLDNRKRVRFTARTIDRARDAYARRWLALRHEDDEAVQGLHALPSLKVSFFKPDFAVAALSFMVLLALPIVFMMAVTSPPLMLGFADVLKTYVYRVEQYSELEASTMGAAAKLRTLSTSLREARVAAKQAGISPDEAAARRRRVDDLRVELAKERRADVAPPSFSEVERATRFKRRFLMRNGKPCEGGSLCGGGHDYALNTKLLFHVFTDEAMSGLLDDDLSALSGLRLALPIVIVPAILGAVALLLVVLLHWIVSLISRYISGRLNRMAVSEIVRSTYGNDTDADIVLGAGQGPVWSAPGDHRAIPAELAGLISARCDEAAAHAISKFRGALGTLTLSDQAEADIISRYLTWKELIHTSYFDIPEFCKLIARAIADCEGFKPTDAFKADPDYARTGRWLEEMGGAALAPPAAAQAT